jgi:hypothetical protein
MNEADGIWISESIFGQIATVEMVFEKNGSMVV